MIEALKRHYGYLFEDELLQDINQCGLFKSVPEGFTLMDIGQTISHMPLLISGALKILREDECGNELLLYFIEQGDTCTMSISCCMGNSKSEIRAIAETPATLIMIPVEKMGAWMGKYKSWQNFILQSYHERTVELLESIDSIAFLKMDERLLKYLKDKAMVNHNEMITVTHQDIAQDLHTSRVVISRLLKKLENDGKLKLYRNQIHLIDL
ncbi:Crp/Fnr family transcriptional regulator [Formosa sediminum]|uniref:Crp/Fnr family transcriptional regulator n=1 Tax=Formosa sediminum TaxID=2594004 RepID=A0A516GVK8_9FLAO|nr:Crp/Fnr family transcriptional regulator [Formosa sediminum]QDO95557.1 Crp/Fnr family transcriptional regulator [Formosa sediminum]